MARVEVNMAALEKSAFSGGNLRTMQALLDKEMDKRVGRSQKIMEKEFDRHPVTMEIEGGATARNISGTLGVGNLFSFIGFPLGSKPTSTIRAALTRKLPTKLKHRGRGVFILEVALDAETIYKATPYPWLAGDSWARGIETGISGLSYYLTKSSSSSRSGGAIQIGTKIRGNTFKTTPYLSELIGNFTERIK